MVAPRRNVGSWRLGLRCAAEGAGERLVCAVAAAEKRRSRVVVVGGFVGGYGGGGGCRAGSSGRVPVG